MEAFDVSFPPASRRSCRVRVGKGALDALVDELAAAPPARRLVIVTDERVGPLHAAPLARRLAERGLAVDSLEIARGEQAKTRATKALIEDRLLALGAGRDTALLAVGGGVVGDVTGFVAATWHRGIPVVQVPTTLLSMTDAALGGKTAVNLDGGKNLVGAFHQPLGIYADVALLATLPDEDYRDGFAEIVKSAAIADAAFFDWLEGASGELLRRDPAATEHAVLTCLQIKAAVVGEDEREEGRRAMLNFGHTVAHAVEAASGQRIGHGTAVAIGLSVEAWLAAERGSLPAGDAQRIAALVAAFGLPTTLPRDPGVASVVEAARRDKKNRDGRIHCALPVRIGQMPPGAGVSVPVAEELLADALRRAIDDGVD